MPTQKVFKQRVRARMTKTGEAYTAARHQLLRKATDPIEPAAASSDPEPTEGASGAEIPEQALLVADEAMLRATGKRHAEWFAILDAWGATDHSHTEIARWLSQNHGTPGWWVQNMTVAYERARGMRKPGQMANGFSVTVSRTVEVDEATVLKAFTDPAFRTRWLTGAPMRQRPTRAARTVRFDWAEPPSRVVVTVVPRDAGKTTVAISHEQLPDAATADRLKLAWRGWADVLKAVLEAA
jgi:uncharacterized protein YndB with AHSA1/START domain